MTNGDLERFRGYAANQIVQGEAARRPAQSRVYLVTVRIDGSAISIEGATNTVNVVVTDTYRRRTA